MVKMFLPATMREAVDKATLQELTLEAIYKRNRSAPRPMPVAGYLTRGNTKALMPAVPMGGVKGGPNTMAN